MSTNLSEFLTPKQRLFCDEFLTDRNATRAALRAGYSSSTALNGQLMQMPKIRAYLQGQMDAVSARAMYTHDMVLKELGKIAFGNMGNYFDAGGRIKPMNELSADEQGALWSVSVSDAGSGASAEVVTKFRMYNKLGALREIAKHIGFYEPETRAEEPAYLYLDNDDLMEDDCFDDWPLQQEIVRQKKQAAQIKKQELRKAENRAKRQEAGSKMREALVSERRNATIGVEALEMPVIENAVLELVAEPLAVAEAVGDVAVVKPERVLSVFELEKQHHAALNAEFKAMNVNTLLYYGLRTHEKVALMERLKSRIE